MPERLGRASLLEVSRESRIDGDSPATDWLPLLYPSPLKDDGYDIADYTDVNPPYFHSLLLWMKRLIALRKRYRALGRGSLEFLYPENRKVLALWS